MKKTLPYLLALAFICTPQTNFGAHVAAQATQDQSFVQANQCDQSKGCDPCNWAAEITKLKAQVKVIDEIIADKMIAPAQGRALSIAQKAFGLILASGLAGAGIKAINSFAKTDNSFYLGIMAAIPILLIEELILHMDINTLTPDQFIKALKQEKWDLERRISIAKQAQAFNMSLPCNQSPASIDSPQVEKLF
ncbi:MAG: hypothetical protein WCT20_01325 [Candidatus Babeliales bacterium]